MKRVLIGIGIATVTAIGLSAVGVIPVRAYVDQRVRIRSGNARLELLQLENTQLADRAQRLQSDAEVERLARLQFGMVRAGEVAYAVPGLRSDDPFRGNDFVPQLPPQRSNTSAGLWSELWDIATAWAR
jgi:cell division protein FtsB